MNNLELSNSEIKLIKKLLESKIWSWKQYEKDLKRGADELEKEDIEEALYKVEQLINVLERIHKKFKEAYNESKINNG